MMNRMCWAGKNSVVVFAFAFVIVIVIAATVTVTTINYENENVHYQQQHEHEHEQMEKEKEKEELPPDPVIISIPQSGNDDNPYFVNITTHHHTSSMTTTTTTMNVNVNITATTSTSTSTSTAEYDQYHRGYYLVKTNYPWSVVLPNINNNSDNNTDDNENNNKHNNSNYRSSRRTSSSSSSLSSSSLMSSSHFLQTTLKQAQIHNCNIVSTNGGPFDQGGITNSGPVIINGKLTRTKSNPIQSKYIGFGIAYDDEDEDESQHESQHESQYESQHDNFVNVSKMSSLSSLSTTTTTTTATTNTDNSNKSKNNKNKNNYWVMGTYGQLVSSSSTSTFNKDTMKKKKKKKIWNFVTGFDWLVYNGKSLVNDNNSTINNNINPKTVGSAYRAPRTVIGLDQDSNLIILVVDGCEHCLHRKGLTLEELADLLLDHGVIFAINMDGGGSSTMVMTTSLAKSNKPTTMMLNNNNGGKNNQNDNYDCDYEVINRPTCLDIPLPYHCQRPVATVLCVSSSSTATAPLSSSTPLSSSM